MPTEDQIRRLRDHLKNDPDVLIPDNIMQQLRHKYGLAAEYYAKLLMMSETEFREWCEEKRKENAINISELTKTHETLRNNFEIHHHHRFGNSKPCTDSHVDYMHM